ncbi:NADH:flavin oxidoreductase/NADH oxidase [Pokkaliibacter sp. CJK22405]|uniref:NADH:flavin oxidoreductase/NADH oxidase n=1 Tax=Pokkaliibacter sp. CJK22405 TaxID=3384615 RepID=UPI003984926A
MASPALFRPLALDQLTLTNRIVIAPMCQYSADNGLATDWHAMHLGQLALSGAGLLILEATAVNPAGRITPDCLGLWSQEHETRLGEILARVRKYSDMPLGIQLAHAGRKASCAIPWEGGKQLSKENGGWDTIAPSAVAFAEDDRLPKAMTDEDIGALIADFRAAAERAVRLGIEVIELHAAHGYLLHEFLSPLSNQRTDNYGGSLENRMRLLLQVFDAVREVVPASHPVGVRISGTDFVDGGWDEEQSIALAQALDAKGCSYIHVSGGGLSTQQQIPVGPNYQVPYARAIREEVKMPVIAVGLITEPQQAEAIIGTGDADAVALARAMLFNPHWPWQAAVALGGQVKAPPQYLRSAPHGFNEVLNG